MKAGDEIFDYKRENDIDREVRLVREHIDSNVKAAKAATDWHVIDVQQELKESSDARARALAVLQKTGKTATASYAAETGAEFHQRLADAGNDVVGNRIANILNGDTKLADVALSKPTASEETAPHNFKFQQRAIDMATQMVTDVATGKAKPYSR